MGSTANMCVCHMVFSLLLWQDEKCHFNPKTVGATDTGYIDIQSKNESALQMAVANVGPISCAMDASHIGFQVRVCWCVGVFRGVHLCACVCSIIYV